MSHITCSRPWSCVEVVGQVGSEATELRAMIDVDFEQVADGVLEQSTRAVGGFLVDDVAGLEPGWPDHPVLNGRIELPGARVGRGRSVDPDPSGGRRWGGVAGTDRHPRLDDRPSSSVSWNSVRRSLLDGSQRGCPHSSTEPGDRCVTRWGEPPPANGSGPGCCACAIGRGALLLLSMRAISATRGPARVGSPHRAASPAPQRLTATILLSLLLPGVAPRAIVGRAPVYRARRIPARLAGVVVRTTGGKISSTLPCWLDASHEEVRPSGCHAERSEHPSR